MKLLGEIPIIRLYANGKLLNGHVIEEAYKQTKACADAAIGRAMQKITDEKNDLF